MSCARRPSSTCRQNLRGYARPEQPSRLPVAAEFSPATRHRTILSRQLPGRNMDKSRQPRSWGVSRTSGWPPRSGWFRGPGSYPALEHPDPALAYLGPPCEELSDWDRTAIPLPGARPGLSRSFGMAIAAVERRCSCPWFRAPRASRTARTRCSRAAPIPLLSRGIYPARACASRNPPPGCFLNLDWAADACRCLLIASYRPHPLHEHGSRSISSAPRGRAGERPQASTAVQLRFDVRNRLCRSSEDAARAALLRRMRSRACCDQRADHRVHARSEPREARGGCSISSSRRGGPSCGGDHPTLSSKRRRLDADAPGGPEVRCGWMRSDGALRRIGISLTRLGT